MKKPNLLDALTLVGLTLLFMLPFFLAGCSMKYVPTSAADVRNCCQRLSTHEAEMAKFNRYCKVALFLANSENKKEVGSGVRKGARDAVNICKFVFNVNTDAELVAAGDEQEHYRSISPTEKHQVAEHLLIKDGPPNDWQQPLDCDPNEPTCEEF